MYNEGKPTLAYISYPYSRDPIKCTREARDLALKVIGQHPNIFPIIPHIAVDILLLGPNYKIEDTQCNKHHTEAELLELILLPKIDLFIIGTEFKDMSLGMGWEYSYIQYLNLSRERPIDVKYIGELLNE